MQNNYPPPKNLWKWGPRGPRWQIMALGFPKQGNRRCRSPKGRRLLGVSTSSEKRATKQGEINQKGRKPTKARRKDNSDCLNREGGARTETPGSKNWVKSFKCSCEKLIKQQTGEIRILKGDMEVGEEEGSKRGGRGRPHCT